MGSKLNSNNIDGDVGGASITNINDINNILKDTSINELITYDTLNGSTFVNTSTTVPHTSPPDNIPFFNYWNYKIDICTPDNTDFSSIQTHNFGRNRGTTDNIVLSSPEITGDRNFRVYYEIDSYPYNPSATPPYYRTEYKFGTFNIYPDFIG